MTLEKTSIELQPRDLQIFQRLLEYTVVTFELLCFICFDNHFEAAKKRIGRLRAEGYLHQHARTHKGEPLYSLTQKSFAVLQHHQLASSELHWSAFARRINPVRSDLQHSLDTFQFNASLERALNATTGYELKIFPSELWEKPIFTRLQRGYGSPQTVIRPDAYLRITDIRNPHQVATFFVEIDRSTETLVHLVEKARAYADFYRSGGYAESLGHSRESYKRYPFRVLMIFKSAERRNNVTERLLQLDPPIRGQVWLTTWQEAVTDPVGAIWVTPREYLEVTKGTPFDPLTHRPTDAYRRNVEREEIVTRVVKKALLS